MNQRDDGRDPELHDALQKLSHGLKKGEDPLYYDWRDASRKPVETRVAPASRPRSPAMVIGLTVAVVVLAGVVWAVLGRSPTNVQPLASASAAEPRASAGALPEPAAVVSEQPMVQGSSSSVPAHKPVTGRPEAGAPKRESFEAVPVPVGPAEF